MPPVCSIFLLIYIQIYSNIERQNIEKIFSFNVPSYSGVIGIVMALHTINGQEGHHVAVPFVHPVLNNRSVCKIAGLR